MNFIGIDLAWTLKNETGICIINDKGVITICESKVFSNKELAEIVFNYSKEGAIVAIDAPLIINNENGSRVAEGLVMKDKIHGRHLSLFNSNRNYMMKTYGSIRGEDVVKEIIMMNKEFKLTSRLNEGKHYIFETFPTGITLGLFPDVFPIKYKIKSRIPIADTKAQMGKMINILNHLESYNPSIKNVEKFFNSSIDVQAFSRSKLKHLEDKVDAFLCAYAAYWHYINRSQERVYGDDENGFIVLPIAD